MANTRIPRTITGFNGYLISTDDYLRLPSPPPANTNWARLGLLQAEADQWHTFRQEWEALYAVYLNANTRTKTVNEAIAEAMEVFRLFAQPLLDIMDVSRNATQEDANALNFKIGRAEPTHPTTPIEFACIPEVIIIGGGAVKFKCRPSDDSKRAAMAKGANIVEVALKVGGNAPVGPMDGTELITLGKANSIFTFETTAIGQRAYAFFRWSNTRYPHLASQFSPYTSFIVS